MVGVTTLEVDGVRAFVMVADHRSFTRAAEALGIKQAAVSVRVKRLEDRVGHRLIERTPRQVRLSAQGEIFLPAAQEFLASHEHAIASLSATRRRFRVGIRSEEHTSELLSLVRLSSAVSC